MSAEPNLQQETIAGLSSLWASHDLAAPLWVDFDFDLHGLMLGVAFQHDLISRTYALWSEPKGSGLTIELTDVGRRLVGQYRRQAGDVVRVLPVSERAASTPTPDPSPQGGGEARGRRTP